MCFSVLWMVQLLVELVIIAGVVAIAMLLLPILLSWLGVAGNLVMQVIRIIVAVIVIIAIIWFVYDIWTCAAGGRLLPR